MSSRLRACSSILCQRRTPVNEQQRYCFRRYGGSTGGRECWRKGVLQGGRTGKREYWRGGVLEGREGVPKGGRARVQEGDMHSVFYKAHARSCAKTCRCIMLGISVSGNMQTCRSSPAASLGTDYRARCHSSWHTAAAPGRPRTRRTY